MPSVAEIPSHVLCHWPPTAMMGKVGLGTLARVIHPYPTQAEGIKAAANAYMRTRLTPLVKRIFETWLSWSR